MKHELIKFIETNENFGHKCQIFPDERMIDFIESSIGLDRMCRNATLHAINIIHDKTYEMKTSGRTLELAQRIAKHFKASGLTGPFGKASQTNKLINAADKFIRMERNAGRYGLDQINDSGITQALRALQDGFGRAFNPKLPLVKWPTSHSMHGRQSFSLQFDGKTQIKYGEFIQFSLPRARKNKQELKISNVRWKDKPENIGSKFTISRNSDGRYYVSFSTVDSIDVRVYDNINEIKQLHIGAIDLGLDELFTDAHGNRALNLEEFTQVQQHKKDLLQWESIHADEQRKLSLLKQVRKKTGSRRSNRQIKQQQRVNRIYQKIVDVRRDYYRKVACVLAEHHDILITEDLSVKSMMSRKKSKRNTRKKFQRFALSDFMRILVNKFKKEGKILHQVGRYFASSQTCSNCGAQDRSSLITDKNKNKVHSCSNCCHVMDRDQNAARNILFEGLSQPPSEKTHRHMWDAIKMNSKMLLDVNVSHRMIKYCSNDHFGVPARHDSTHHVCYPA